MIRPGNFGVLPLVDGFIISAGNTTTSSRCARILTKRCSTLVAKRSAKAWRGVLLANSGVLIPLQRQPDPQVARILFRDLI